MANEPTNTNPALDPRAEQLAELQKHVLDLNANNEAQIKNLEAKIAGLEEKLLSFPVVPDGDYCVLGGQTYTVAGTVCCRFATDEGRKGHIELDSDLVILKR
jgi:hypothetical protein